MKIAVSIPDPLFEEAERLAAARGTSRSRLYSDALADFVARHADDQVTERLDAVYDALGEEAEIDPLVEHAARTVLTHTEW